MLLKMKNSRALKKLKMAFKFHFCGTDEIIETGHMIIYLAFLVPIVSECNNVRFTFIW